MKSIIYVHYHCTNASTIHKGYLNNQDRTNTNPTNTNAPLFPRQHPTHFLLRRPNPHIIHRHRVPTHRARRRRLSSSKRIRITATHRHIQNQIEALMESLIPHRSSQIVRGDGVDELAIEPVLDALRGSRAVDDDFVDVEVSAAEGALADGGSAAAGVFVAFAARGDVLMDCKNVFRRAMVKTLELTQCKTLPVWLLPPFAASMISISPHIGQEVLLLRNWPPNIQNAGQ